MRQRPFLATALVFLSMLSGTLLIATARPLIAAIHPGHEDALHAFFSVNMLGAVIGAPLLAHLADRTGAMRPMLAVLAVVDGIAVVCCTLPIPIPAMLALRLVQGAASVGALSILMGRASALGRRGSHDSGAARSGVAVVAAIAAGAPLGTLCSLLGVRAPFFLAAASAFAVAAAAPLLAAPGQRAPRGSLRALLRRAPVLRVPTLLIAGERFAVGGFVVTFALHAHHVLGLSDVATSALYSWFLLPFAALTWPASWVASRVPRTHMIAIAAVVYALAFALLGVATPSQLPFLLAASGAASAAIFAPSLCLVTELAPVELRSTAMGFANAGGTIGMLLGTAFAGIASATLVANGVERGVADTWIFACAGVAQFGVAIVALPALARWRAVLGREQV